MRNILLILILFCSCNKDYSLEYFKQYNADAPNRVMQHTKDFKEVKDILIEKTGYDLFIVSIKYVSKLDSSKLAFSEFNHNGKMLNYYNE